MSFTIDFESIKEKAGNLVQAGVSQSKKVAAIAKLKSDNLSQKDTLRKAYLAIGKQYYAEKVGQPDEAYAALFAQADAALATIAANNAKLEEMKAAEEVIITAEDIDLEDAEEVSAEAEDAVAEEAPAEEAPVAEETAEEAPVEEAPAAEEEEL